MNCRISGFAKDTTPFSLEFLWADFLRRRLSRKIVEDHRLRETVEQALSSAQEQDAIYLPG